MFGIGSGDGIGIFGIIVILALYFIPLMVANGRKHQNAMAIGVLNVFAGWTFIGWVIALVWACTGNTAEPSMQPGTDSKGVAK